MSSDLKSCPFCGGEANLMSYYSSEHDHTFWHVWHDCSTNPGPILHTYGHALGMEVSTPWCASEDAAVELWNRREEVVRCRDCASIKPTTDGRRYCKRWSRIVPLDGFCWRGEAKSGEEAQEG